MTLGDAAAVAAIEAVVSPEPWSLALLEGEFDVAPDTRHWVVATAIGGDEPGAIIGFAGMMFVGGGSGEGEGHLMNVAVHPDHRRGGVAAALCSAAFDHAADAGFDALTLEVRVSNRAAIELYRRFGFAPVGNRPGYYANRDGSKEDGLIMWLHDNIHRRRVAADRSEGSRA